MLLWWPRSELPAVCVFWEAISLGWMGLLGCRFYWGWWVWGFLFVCKGGVFCFGGCVSYVYFLCFAEFLFLGIYLFSIPTVLFLSEAVLALLAWVLQPWQGEWFWAMQSDCSSVTLKTCPHRSASCGCVSMWVCQFVTTFLELTFWTCPLTILWSVLWRAFGAQTGFLLYRTNLRDMFLEYSYCPSVASVCSVRGTCWGLVLSQSLLPSLSCSVYREWRILSTVSLCGTTPVLGCSAC